MFDEFSDAVFISNAGGEDGVGFSLVYRQGALRAIMKTEDMVWFLALPHLQVNTWYNMEFAWKADEGLTVHANNLLLGNSAMGVAREVPAARLVTGPIHVGR